MAQPRPLPFPPSWPRACAQLSPEPTFPAQRAKPHRPTFPQHPLQRPSPAGRPPRAPPSLLVQRIHPRSTRAARVRLRLTRRTSLSATPPAQRSLARPPPPHLADNRPRNPVGPPGSHTPLGPHALPAPPLTARARVSAPSPSSRNRTPRSPPSCSPAFPWARPPKIPGAFLNAPARTPRNPSHPSSAATPQP